MANLNVVAPTQRVPHIQQRYADGGRFDTAAGRHRRGAYPHKNDHPQHRHRHHLRHIERIETGSTRRNRHEKRRNQLSS